MSVIDYGFVRPGRTLFIPWHTFDSNDPSASVTLSGLLTSDIEIYKDGGVTQRASDSGYALLDTDGIDFDGITGIHGISIDLADNTTAGFYSAGSQYWVVISSVTIDAATVNFVLATFRIGLDGCALNTTIATLASQTSFTLTVGPAEDDALNGCAIYIHDVASAVQSGFAIVGDYTGSTKTVTLVAGTTFTAAATDNVSVFPPTLQPTSWGRTLDVNAAGEAGLDYANTSGTIDATDLATGVITAAKFAAGAIDAAAIADGAIDAATLATGTITAAKFAAGAIDAAAVADGAIDAATFAAGAITAAAIATDAIGAAELAADAVTEIQAGLATAAALATVQADTDDIQTRLPAALVSGRIDASVGAMASGVLTATAIATDAITAAKIAADAIGASELAADAVTEIQSGLATSAALATVQADTDDIQTRIPAALVSGRIDASVGAVASGAITATAIAADAIGASELAADAVTEIQSGLATAASITTLSALVDDLESRLGTPSNLGGGATVAANLADIEGQTDDIGVAGVGLTAIPWNAAWDAEVQSEVDDALNTAITELSQGIPTATPTVRTALMLLYMATRNALTVSATSKTVSNDAGTVIAKKGLSDDGSVYTEAEMASGP